MKKYPISIIIPVYKNYDMFYKYLEINKKYFDGCEVIIGNDFPKENITKYVKRIYKEAVVFNNKKNLGFPGNVNKGVKLAKRPYIFLMNSDVILKNDSFKKSINFFKKNKKLFAIAFSQKEINGQIVGCNQGYFENGLINHTRRSNLNKLVTLNFWAEAGASIFKRKLFINLGMMDEIYRPFYWEDVDLSYRAWKAGYQIIFTKNILVEHHHESTIGKYFDQKRIKKIAFRNQLIFNWKNITDKGLLLNHFINLPRYVLTAGFFDALLLLPKIIQSRKKVIKLFKKTDKEVLDLFKK